MVPKRVPENRRNSRLVSREVADRFAITAPVSFWYRPEPRRSEYDNRGPMSVDIAGMFVTGERS